MAESRTPTPTALGSDAAAEIERLRDAIDSLDRAVLEQLNERARLVQRIGSLKPPGGAAVYDGAREQRILAGLTAINPGPFPDAGVAPVFREIISATRSLEGVLRVSYLGPEGTFTHMAARERFGALADLRGAASISEVFADVERDKVAFGVVPIENTTEGVVTATLDALAVTDVAICGEALLGVSHHLLSLSGRLDQIERVASHPQVFAQCRGWLERNLRGVPRVETSSTAEAARRAASDHKVAALASSLAGSVYGLETVEPAVEDRQDNTTRFVVIGKVAPPPSGDDLTSAVFTLRRDEAGGLHRLLEPFARAGVNLTSLQLRPIAGKPWEYFFFLDVEGHQEDERVAGALAEAAGRANSHRLLGSFPRCRSARVERPEGR